MKNKHIELVKKWMADKDSVSLVELEAAYAEAHTAGAVANAIEAAVESAAWSADAEAAYAAAKAIDVAYWIRRYEELTNEK